jgi:hypothetical protein
MSNHAADPDYRQPSAAKTSFRDRLAEPSRLFFAAIAAFLQSLLQTCLERL